MLEFYYNPRSPMARRVWITLIEKGIPFEPILLTLSGEQFQSEYLKLNPFHHIPVIVDDGFRIIESLAIMDYLENKYPIPALLPTEPQALAIVRMVQMVTSNELLPKIVALIFASKDSPQFAEAKEHIDKVLQFFTEILGNSLYFGSNQLTLGDIVAGAAIAYLVNLDTSITKYPTLNQWWGRLREREAWQKTELSREEFEQFTRVLVKLRGRASK